MADFLFVGLGNPGPGYAGTRHNIGARVIDEVASRYRVKLKRGRRQSRTADTPIGTIAIPTTFMNDSGRAVAPLMKGRPITELMLIYDELDLPLGRIRLKEGGGTAGHNGVRSVAASLRSPDFLRLRIGIGRPPAGVDPVDHVLTRFRPDERETIDAAVESSVEGLEIFVKEGIDAAQRFWHT